MADDREKFNKFKEIYGDGMLAREGMCQVLYLGTTRELKWQDGQLRVWEAGRADLGIKVCGHGVIPGEVKIDGVLLTEKLTYELNLRLEDVPLQHWTPI